MAYLGAHLSLPPGMMTPRCPTIIIPLLFLALFILSAQLSAPYQLHNNNTHMHTHAEEWILDPSSSHTFSKGSCACECCGVMVRQKQASPPLSKLDVVQRTQAQGSGDLTT